MMRAIFRSSTAVLCLLLAGMGGAHAQGKTIDQLSAGAALAGSELIPMFQSGNPAVTTTPAAIATYIAQSLTMTGKLTTAAPVAGGAQFNLPQGTAPATPNNGDLWTTSTGLFVRINGSTVGPLSAGGSPAGSTGAIQFNNAGAFGGDSNFTYAGAGGRLNLQPAANQNQPFLISGGSITGSSTSTLGYAVTGTLNTTGNVDGAALFANIANTASGAGSTLLDLQVSGVSKFSVNTAGALSLASGTVANPAVQFGSGGLASRCGGCVDLIDTVASGALMEGFSSSSGSGVLKLASYVDLQWTSSGDATGGPDSGLARNAAGVVEVNNGTPGTFRDLLARQLISSPTTVSSLPTCGASNEGAREYVTDQNTAVSFRGAVTGGGSTREAVLCNNSAWIQD